MKLRTDYEEYIYHYKKEKYIIFTLRIAILIIFLFSWEFASYLEIIDVFFFSSPSKIINLLIKLSKNFELFNHTAVTIFETILSFFYVTAISIIVAIILIMNKRLSKVLEPYIVILNSLPKSALAPLIIVWLGTGMKTIIIAGASVAIFGSIINLYTGFNSVDQDKLKLIYTLGGNKYHCLQKVIIPASIPLILSNMKINIGLCLVGVIIGEFLAAKKGLGYLIIYSSQIFRLDLLILSILILSIIAFLFYQGIQFFEKKQQK